MDSDREGNVRAVGPSKAQASRKEASLFKRKRRGEKEVEKTQGKGKERFSEVWEERKEEEGAVKTMVSLDEKGRKNVWRNFHVGTTKMGLVREHINPNVIEGRDGTIQLEELIDLGLVILSDNAWETGMTFLNNARNNLMDNFWSFKWIFHEIEGLKYMM